MEQFFYAQLDENSVCVAVSQLGGSVDADNMMRLTDEEFARGLLGQRYADGVWHEAQPPPDTPDELKTRKLDEVNAACQAAIYAGIDVETSEGMKHFSLTEHDQTELLGLSAQVKDGAPVVPYHADGELCRFWSVEDFMRITMSAQAHVFFHRTYVNHLREHVKRTDDMDELRGVYYGMDLPDDLAENMALLIGGVPGA